MLPKGLLKEYSHLIAICTRLTDLAVILCAGYIAHLIKFYTVSMTMPYVIAMAMSACCASLMFSFFGVYVSWRGQRFIRHILCLLEALLGTIASLASLAFFTKTGTFYSREWFVIWMGIATIGLISVRCSILLLLRLMRTHGLNERRVVIIGVTELGAQLAQTVQQALWTGFHIVAFFKETISQPDSAHPIPMVPLPTDLMRYIVTYEIDEVWLALPLQAEQRVKEILFELRHATVAIRLVLDIFGLDLLNHSVTDLAGFPALNIRSTPMIGMNRLVKAIEDRLLAMVMLGCVSPLFVLIALGIKMTSKGPIFFKQTRLGWDGRLITIYKFRTMIQHEEQEGQVTQATRNDKRITPLGKWLRRLSLDELPQLINVLQGQMSIVGPRPHALPHNELYKDIIHTYMQRYRVKPGLTGWAQVNGWRGETATLDKMQKRIEYDLYYISHWSFWFDVKIIFLTLYRGWTHRNAY